MLDLASVRMFILAVDLGNLTRAAEAAGTVQPAVSARIRTLEARLGTRLLERTPRFVQPTAAGLAFLPKARVLMAAHDDAVSRENTPPMIFRLGFSDQAVGAGLGHLIRRLRSALPLRGTIELQLGMSGRMRAAFDAGSLDAVVVRREAGGAGGELLGRDPLGWRGAEHTQAATPVPLVTLGPPCGVRAMAIKRLDEVGYAWHEAFVGGSCTALLAAVEAGLGIAPMGLIASGGLADCGQRLGLPPLPASEIVMFARTGSKHARSAIDALEAVTRAMLRAG